MVFGEDIGCIDIEVLMFRSEKVVVSGEVLRSCLETMST